MTALAQYERLEAPGLYFDGETARSREVVVKFGDASLIVLSLEDVPITHWSLAGLRDISQKSGGLALTPDPDGDERLLIEDAEMAAAIVAVCPDLRKVRAASGRSWARVALWSAAALGAVYAIIFHLVPALSDQMAVLIPPEAEVALGDEMAGQFARLLTREDEPRYCSTRAGDRALAALTDRLAAGAETHVPLDVRVLDHPMVNAFALPGGRIVVFRGLLREAESPEELAGVLAHEIGHVAARDPTRLALRSAGTAGLLGLLLGDVTGATATVALSEAMLRSGYQREAETEADRYAADLLAREGLPTGPLAGFFDKLRDVHGDTPKLFSHLSTHPDLKGRAEATREADTIGDGTFRPALSDQQWVALRNICQDG